MSAPAEKVSQPTVHELKCWPQFYAAVVDGRKQFEIRRDDRGFKVGDILHLREFIPVLGEAGGGHYTGLLIERTVTLITGWHQIPGFVVMGLSTPPSVDERQQAIEEATIGVEHEHLCIRNERGWLLWNRKLEQLTAGGIDLASILEIASKEALSSAPKAR